MTGHSGKAQSFTSKDDAHSDLRTNRPMTSVKQNDQPFVDLGRSSHSVCFISVYIRALGARLLVTHVGTVACSQKHKPSSL